MTASEKLDLGLGDPAGLRLIGHGLMTEAARFLVLSDLFEAATLAESNVNSGRKMLAVGRWTQAAIDASLEQAEESVREAAKQHREMLQAAGAMSVMLDEAVAAFDKEGDD